MNLSYYRQSCYAGSWTNFSLQDEPWAEFTTLEVAACIPCTYLPNLELKSRPKLVLGSLQLAFTLPGWLHHFLLLCWVSIC